MKFQIDQIVLNKKDLSSHPGNWITLQLDGKPVDPYEPIWVTGKDVENLKGSFQPAAFIIGKPTPRLTVTITVDSSWPTHPSGYTLLGYMDEGKGTMLGGPHLTGHIKPRVKAAKQMDFDVVFNRSSNDFNGLAMDVSWHLQSTEDASQYPGDSFFVTTFLEFYWLYSGLNHSMFWNGVPVRLLRFLAPVCIVFSVSATWFQDLLQHPAVAIMHTTENIDSDSSHPQPRINQLIQYITKALFYRNPPRYDIYFGANHYTDVIWYPKPELNINVYLEHYLNSLYEDGTLCNCQDQAALLYVFLSVIGINDLKVCWMNPFGYMRLSNLVGRGLCNNPKYQNERNYRIVDSNSTDRASFGYHSFCLWQDKWVLDACVGPHVGTEDKEQYVSHALDYAKPPGKPSPGTVKNIFPHQIIANLNYIVDPQFDPCKETAEAGNNVFRSWPDPRACPLLGTDWVIFHQKTVAGDVEVKKNWELRRRGESVKIRLYVFSARGSEAVKERYYQIEHGVTFMDDTYTQGPPYFGDFSAKSVGDNPSRYFWIPQMRKSEIFNVVFDVVCKNVNFNVEGLAVWLNELAISSRVGKIKDYLPAKPKITLKPTEPTVGSVFSLTFDLDESENIFVNSRVVAGDGLRLVSQQVDNNKMIMKILATKKSTNTLRLVLVDEDTLLSQSLDTNISVENKQ